MLWRSMKQLQDENLSLHLYNAYALKRRAANPATAPDLVLKTVCRYVFFLWIIGLLTASTGGWYRCCMGTTKNLDGLAIATKVSASRWPVQR